MYYNEAPPSCQGHLLAVSLSVRRPLTGQVLVQGRLPAKSLLSGVGGLRLLLLRGLLLAQQRFSHAGFAGRLDISQ